LYLNLTGDAIGTLVVEVHDDLAAAHLRQPGEAATFTRDLRVIAISNLLLGAVSHLDGQPATLAEWPAAALTAVRPASAAADQVLVRTLAPKVPAPTRLRDRCT
jgi:hypothetical protein